MPAASAAPTTTQGLGPPLFFAFGRERNGKRTRRRLVAHNRLTCNLGKVDRLAADGKLAPVHAREIEQVANETLEPLRFDENRARRFL